MLTSVIGFIACASYNPIVTERQAIDGLCIEYRIIECVEDVILYPDVAMKRRWGFLRSRDNRKDVVTLAKLVTDSNFDFSTRIQATEGELLDQVGRNPSWAMAQLGLLPTCGFLAMVRDVVVCQRAKHDSIVAFSSARAQRPHTDARR